MTTIADFQSFFKDLDYRIVIAADAETRTHHCEEGQIVERTPAGGVSVAFDILCQVAGGTHIGRARMNEDRQVVDANDKVCIRGDLGSYDLKRLFLSPEEEETYYTGFANQTLWPLCHIAFERPIFDKCWYQGYVEVNRKFAESIQEELQGRSFVWINDYQLSLVPGFLDKNADTVVGMFWHIPWPTWELFRILPYKREILESLLKCDFIAFHRRYQARNFLNAVDRELRARIDFETNTIYWDGHRVQVGSLPMGIDVDVIRKQFEPDNHTLSILESILASFRLGGSAAEQAPKASGDLGEIYARYDVLLGVDRLDYTKGIKERLMGLDRFFEENPRYKDRVVYIGVMSPTRLSIPSYQGLREEVETLAGEINRKHGTGDWEPLHMVFEGSTREDVLDLYRRARVCLVTPLDDGMNLVSKEFIVAASCSDDPGMLVLSQFAGSATDLSAAIIVNPYDTDALAAAVREALEMDRDERQARMSHMVSLLEERNVYEWAMSFVRSAMSAVREQQHEIVTVA